jgi:YHS domain-containing protein
MKNIHFFINYFASKHLDYSHLYTNKAKKNLDKAYHRIRFTSMKTGKIYYWSGEQLFKFFKEKKQAYLLMGTHVDREFWDVVHPTHWFDQQVVNQVLEKY